MYKQLYDPVSGVKLEVYGMRAPSDEVYRVDAEPIIRNLSLEYRVSEDEMERRLVNSDPDNPITYRDEVFWCE
jgi:hypothetical protein